MRQYTMLQPSRKRSTSVSQKHLPNAGRHTENPSLTKNTMANRSVAVRRTSPTGILTQKKSSDVMMIALVLAAMLIVYFIMKNKGIAGQYANEETWDMSYNSDGLPTSITIHRKAERS